MTRAYELQEGSSSFLQHAWQLVSMEVILSRQLHAWPVAITAQLGLFWCAGI